MPMAASAGSEPSSPGSSASAALERGVVSSQGDGCSSGTAVSVDRSEQLWDRRQVAGQQVPVVCTAVTFNTFAELAEILERNPELWDEPPAGTAAVQAAQDLGTCMCCRLYGLWIVHAVQEYCRKRLHKQHKHLLLLLVSPEALQNLAQL